jgi:CBS domain containing-hemolysin-like protein
LTILLLYVGFALSVSFICSLLEAAFLSVRLGVLSERQAAGSHGSALLLELKRRRVDESISAILILNTVANTLGATMAGAEAAKVFGSEAVGWFSGVLTLAILIASEIVPKTLGALYAASLAPFVGYTLQGLTRLMAPALALSRLLTRLLAPRQPAGGLSKGELTALIAAASSDGALTPAESALLGNLLRADQVRVEDVMTPRPMIVMLRAGASVAELLAEPEVDAFSRIPLFEEGHDNVVGYVLLRDVLKAVAAGADRGRQLASFMRPVWFIPGSITVGTALNQFLARREPIAMVVDEHGGLAGLVTLEDLTETVLGAEIVDESDRVVDLRKAAMDHRDRRLERLRRKREQATGGPPRPD